MPALGESARKFLEWLNKRTVDGLVPRTFLDELKDRVARLCWLADSAELTNEDEIGGLKLFHLSPAVRAG